MADPKQNPSDPDSKNFTADKTESERFGQVDAVPQDPCRSADGMGPDEYSPNPI